VERYGVSADDMRGASYGSAGDLSTWGLATFEAQMRIGLTVG
jgi:hypothetical protein